MRLRITKTRQFDSQNYLNNIIVKFLAGIITKNAKKMHLTFILQKFFKSSIGIKNEK